MISPTYLLPTIAGFYSVCVVAILHWLRPDCDARRTGVSHYANGRYGWLMTTALVGQMASVLGLALLMRDGGEQIASSSLMVSATGVGGVIVSPYGINRTLTLSHNIWTAVAVGFYLLGALIFDWPLNPGTGPLTVVGQITGALGCVAAVALVVSYSYELQAAGSIQRVLLAVLFFWMLCANISLIASL
jgi:hypothetical protein